MRKIFHQFKEGVYVGTIKGRNAPDIDGTDITHQIESDTVFDYPIKYDKTNKKIVPQKEVNKGTEEEHDWKYEKDDAKSEIAIEAKKLKVRK